MARRAVCDLCNEFMLRPGRTDWCGCQMTADQTDKLVPGTTQHNTTSQQFWRRYDLTGVRIKNLADRAV